MNCEISCGRSYSSRMLEGFGEGAEVKTHLADGSGIIDHKYQILPTF